MHVKVTVINLVYKRVSISLKWHLHNLLLQPAFTLSTKVMYDRRVQMMNLIKCTPVDYLMRLLYPRLYAVHMLTERVSIHPTYQMRW